MRLCGKSPAVPPSARRPVPAKSVRPPARNLHLNPHPPPPAPRQATAPILAALLLAALSACRTAPLPGAPEFADGVAYAHQRVASVPWSIHVVRADRTAPGLELFSVHAQGEALGLGTLNDQVLGFDPAWGTPLAAVNGDFYSTNAPYPGDPRGLQITAHGLISAPSGGAVFWLDAAGRPQATNVVSRFRVIWPDGCAAPFDLNEDRAAGFPALYTPAAGSSTGTTGGVELVLEHAGHGPWLPLQVGEVYAGRVREVRAGGNAPVAPDTMVLSLAPALTNFVPEARPGTVLRIVTETSPDLRGARLAISAGPVIVRDGARARLVKPPGRRRLPFRILHIWQRHPRAAIGWNDRHFYFVVVDGRQKKLSAGMTLAELARYFIHLGCTDAMNLDGGGSATLWFQGEVRSSPSDRPRTRFAKEDILDLDALAACWRQPADGVSRFLAHRFSASLHLLLATSNATARHESRLRQFVTDELNRLVQGPSIYDAARFAEVGLSEETQALLRERVKGEDRARLNRLLLEDAYPRALARSPASRERKVANSLVIARPPGRCGEAAGPAPPAGQ